MSDPGSNRIGCREFRETLRVDRRRFIRAGLLGAGGVALADLLRVEVCAAASGSPAAARTPSVILLWMRGGPSHIDMWDPKPGAPLDELC